MALLKYSGLKSWGYEVAKSWSRVFGSRVFPFWSPVVGDSLFPASCTLHCVAVHNLQSSSTHILSSSRHSCVYFTDDETFTWNTWFVCGHLAGEAGQVSLDLNLVFSGAPQQWPEFIVSLRNPHKHMWNKENWDLKTLRYYLQVQWETRVHQWCFK